jgi:hypothetical protein
MTALNILPECYVDTKLAEILGNATKKYNHQHGHGNVANKMKYALANQFALGIIDEDTVKVRKAKYFSEFIDVKEENSLKLKKHPAKQHYLIIICPEIEEFIFRNAAKVNIQPETFGLPSEMRGFVHISKSKDIDINIGFKRMIKEMLNLKAPGIVTLSFWIHSFMNGNMNTIE